MPSTVTIVNSVDDNGVARSDATCECSWETAKLHIFDPKAAWNEAYQESMRHVVNEHKGDGGVRTGRN